VQDPFNQENRPRKRSNILLRIDSWIDSSIWNAGFRVGEVWEEITIFFRRFRTRGVWKAVFEIAGEGMNVGTAGFVLLLALALPAFEETSGNWRARDDFAVTFLDRYGNEIGRRGVIHEDSVPVDQLPDHFVKAVLATEDRRFFEHFGIDFLGLARAMTENVKANSVVQGGSTITQQLAKNLFLTNERTIERKVKEAFLAFWLEANLPKSEILRLYLDRAYMGGGTFGAAAAARFYFGKNITEVSIAEAAMLAGLFKAPARYAPHINLPAARARANEVLSNLVQGDLMTEGQVIGARRNPADVIDRGDTDAPDYFSTGPLRRSSASPAALTSIPLSCARPSISACRRPPKRRWKPRCASIGERYRAAQASLVLIENGGAVRAMVGGRDYGESQFNRASRALRQPGSSFKIYTYSLAMEKGMTPETSIVDAPIYWGNWNPKNYSGGYSGRVLMKDALSRSINTIPVRLAKERLGEDAIGQIMEQAKKFGVQTPIRRDVTIPIGTSEVTVLDQATAYAVFPAGGLESRRHGVSQILAYNGEVLYDFIRDEPPAKRVLSEQAADYMNQMLTRVPYVGTARRAAVDGVLTGGKTGTTQAYRDAWFCGYTGNFTAAVWYGNDDYTSSNRMTGGSLPAMTFKRLMDYAHQDIELRAIPGVADPFPAAIASARVATAQTDANGNALPALQRPRTLSRESTAILRGLGQTFENAKPLSAPERLAAAGTTVEQVPNTIER
jgi:penicillin-binding protein 1A